jgi:hypothetical protein
MRLAQEVSNLGANRVTASDLAERAERADLLGDMQVRSPFASSTAITRSNFVVVKNLYGEKLNFTSERKAGNECVHPVSLPRFA